MNIQINDLRIAEEEQRQWEEQLWEEEVRRKKLGIYKERRKFLAKEKNKKWKY